MDSMEDAAFEKALRFLYERSLSKEGLQAEITVIKKEPSKQDKGGESWAS